MTKKDKALTTIYKLSESGTCSTKKQKYLRNLRRYLYSDTANFDDYFVAGFNTFTSDYTQINVIRSVIDTLVNKLAGIKVRPFFNTINGNYRDRRVVRSIQNYFDVWSDEVSLQSIVTGAFKDACIFDTGVIYIDPDKRSLKRLEPWNVFTDIAEQRYGEVQRVLVKADKVPVQLVPEVKTDREYVTTYEYWDTSTQERWIYIKEEDQLFNRDAVEELPFVFLHFENSLASGTSESIVDILNSIQREIDKTYAKISDAFKRNLGSIFWVPEGSSLDVNELDSGFGNVVSYRPVPGGSGIPIEQTIYPALDRQYFEYVQALYQQAFKEVGLSELSAIGRKDSGLDSGVAIKTVQNIESDRFQVVLDEVICTYSAIARKAILLFNGNILPEQKSDVSWKDARKELANMRLQFSGADAISKDPQTKETTIQTLKSLGVPNTELVALFEIPDLERGYSIVNNTINAIQEIIEDCLENDSYEVPNFVHFPSLLEEIQSAQLNLTACGYKKNKAEIDKLQKLWGIVREKQQKVAEDSAYVEQETLQQSQEQALQQVQPSQESPDLAMESDESSWR